MKTLSHRTLYIVFFFNPFYSVVLHQNKDTNTHTNINTRIQTHTHTHTHKQTQKHKSQDVYIITYPTFITELQTFDEGVR